MTLHRVLGIESSCDDTAAAIVEADEERTSILSSVVAGQAELHAAFGGVVPEIAARAHAERLDLAIEKALAEARIGMADVTAIAVTAGPGLIGGLMAGVMCAKAIAAATAKPLVAVNHIAAHALTVRLTDRASFPYLALIVSGGHAQFLMVEAPDRFRRLGGTIDDAPGEAFDKVAKILGLGQPGGPAVEAEAASGDPARFEFPRPLLSRPGCDLSFSGLKTAVLRVRDEQIARHGGLRAQDRRDICAGFQTAVADILAEKSRRAIELLQESGPADPVLAVAGGVASNREVRSRLLGLCRDLGVRFLAPPLALCTDNGAMVAWAGIELLRSGQGGGADFQARPRWPLDTTARAILGSGRKGAKA